ncbi:MAG: two-component regulator propeller domain-containing protein [Saprospiraceae bacterium]|nr:two-component regulator propeller domain-containing protein [Saprospiraceae bacterium]
MKEYTLRTTTTFIFTIVIVLITSCNYRTQQKPTEKEDLSTHHSSKQISQKKVPIPKYGFSCGLLDHKGDLWFGSNGGGLIRYDGTHFHSIPIYEEICDNQIHSIEEDHQQSLLMGTQNGICKYDGKVFTTIDIPFSDTSSSWLDKVYPVFSPNAVHSLLEDRTGQIWIGTAGAGVYQYDGKNFTSYLTEIGTKQEDSLYHNWVPDIMEDRDGNIWFASMTHGGASRFDGKEFNHYSIKEGLSDDMVRIIYQDSQGRIWFGFNGNRNSGLTYYDGKTFHTFTEKDGLCTKNIMSIYEDEKSRIWVGGMQGLCYFNGKTFQSITDKKGQTIERTRFILSDQEENIWFGGMNGLWRYDGVVVTDMTK